MEFIDFLQYGAIGISLALAIFSYRLLSKEQNRDLIRIPMLNSIKWYMVLAVFLSTFFGFIEFFSVKKEPSIIDKIWSANFSEYEDTTYNAKVKLIKSSININSEYSNPNNSYDELNRKYSNCIDKLRDCSKPENPIFYQINELEQFFQKHKRKWFYLKNLEFIKNTDERKELFEIINRILIALGPYSERGTNIDQIMKNWANFVKDYSSLRKNLKKDPYYHIQTSDIMIILKVYVQ